MTRKNAVETAGLSHRYGDVQALSEVSLEIYEGEFFALLGPNGAGKTTLVNLLMTLLPPDGGQAWVLGHDVAKQPEAVRRLLGVVFQDPALDDRLTAVENLEIHAVLYGLPRRRRAEAVQRAVAWAALEEAAKRLVRTYSGGMKRRLELARALLHDPRLLILDEPTIGLDPQGRLNLWERISSLRANGMTVLMTTHNLPEAETCDRVGILDRGKLIAVGSPGELIAANGGEGATLEDVFIALTGRQLRDENATARDLMVSFARRGGEHTR
ncbi:ABC transporter ATP-binding protein [Roseitranquillus sediminis]|uniref:ABC transporter ATP-binding protein n=1 Tax=Roseitranquillus sediminis TaxID=2809051 RepID=UPI001D0C21AE|nr:ATP-binding cassette domain-containing protein [Roseitranquillus sediminis]MBM9595468.1 ATP-binding cassette domain-containing protein [Roseitranquillus sediminis]